MLTMILNFLKSVWSPNISIGNSKNTTNIHVSIILNSESSKNKKELDD